MPPTSSSSAPVVDPIELLSQQIAPAVKKKANNIKLPSNLVKAVKSELRAVQTSNNHVSDAIIIAIVSAFDEQKETCSRFDSASFAIILQTLLHANYSRKKERGIILLAASLHHDAHKTPTAKAIKVKKGAIGKECLLSLLTCFTNPLENDRIRKWVGVLIHQLLDRCDENRMIFESGPEDSKRKLGTMVVEEKNEIVRITCGQLLRALIAWQIPAQDLWPIGSDPTLYDNFPQSSQNEKQWNKAFQKYVDDQFISPIPTQDSGRLYFATTLDTDPMRIHISGCTINIFVERDVSICTQSTDLSFMESFEIPFQLIAGADIEEKLLDGIANPPVDLILRLKVPGDLFCHVNALPVNVSEVRLTVLDEALAYVIGQDVLQPRSGQKASQSRDSIAVMNGFHDLVCSEDNQGIENSNEARANLCLDPVVLRPKEESQDNEQNVECDRFVDQSSQGKDIIGSDSKLNHILGENLEADTGPTAESIHKNGQIGSDNHVPLQSTAPARLSCQTESDEKALAEKENNLHHDFTIGHGPSRWNLRRKALLVRSIPKTTIPDASSNQDVGEMTGLVAHGVVSPVAKTQSKAKHAHSKTNIVPKAKHKMTKPKGPIAEVKNLKKHRPQPRPEAPIFKAAATEQLSAPRLTTPENPISEGSLTVSPPKPGSIPKPASGLIPKTPKNTTSKSLVPKKPIHQSQASLPKLNLEPQGMQKFASSLKGLAVKTSSLHAYGSLTQERRAINRRTSRLSQALANISSTDGRDASFEELIPKSLGHQRSQVTSQTASTPSPAVTQGTPVPEHADADLPGILTPEAIHIISKDNESLSSHRRIPTESSPSSLERISPVPLPVQETSPGERLTLDATPVPSKAVAGPNGPRRSPRLASRYVSREAPAALSSVQTKATRLVRKPIVIDESDNHEFPHKIATWDDDTPFRAEESPLLDEHLARKTPLISFSVDGPQNQGINISKKSSMQRGKKAQNEEPGNRILRTQKYTPSKRKRDQDNDPGIEDNKRQQTCPLQKPKERPSTRRKESPAVLHSAERHRVLKNAPATRKAGKFGSQGSRVNENGSPRGKSNIFKEDTDYKAIVRKVLTHKEPTPANGESAFLPCEYNDVVDVVESDHEIVLNLPTTSSTSFIVPLLSPRPVEEVIKRYLPRSRATNLEHLKIGTKVAYHPQEKSADPFLKEGPERSLSSFARRLQYRRQTPTQKRRKHVASRIPRNTTYAMNDDLEATLVNVENERPMGKYSSSSESSDEDQIQGARKAPAEVQQMQCDEWRMALKPHQRGILDILNQVSADLVRHLISHEQAIEDVLTEYEQGSNLLVRDLERTHQDDRCRIQHELDKIKGTMIIEYKEARVEISRINKAIRARPIRQLEKEWMQEQDELQRLIEEGMMKRK